MATTGTGIVFSNSGVAKTDYFASSLTGLTEDNTNTIGTVYLDVLGNDGGGKAKVLWSLDDGVSANIVQGGISAPIDLLTQDSARVEELSLDHSAHGAHIWITADGRVAYDASTLSSEFRSQLQALGAGQNLTDTFTYAIRLANVGPLQR